MSRTTRILLGLLAFFPIGYIAFFMAYVGLLMTSMFATFPTQGAVPTGRAPDPFPFIVPFFALFGLHFLAVLVTIVQTVVYLVLAWGNEDLSENEKLVWVVVIFMAGFVGSPAYWYLKIWKAPYEEMPPLPR